MGSAPEKTQLVTARNRADQPELFGQVALDFGHVVADLGVELDVTLEQLWLDRARKLWRDFAQNLGSAAPQCHRMAIDQIELDLDSERGLGIADKLVGAHAVSLRERLASRITL